MFSAVADSVVSLVLGISGHFIPQLRCDGGFTTWSSRSQLSSVALPVSPVSRSQTQCTNWVAVPSQELEQSLTGPIRHLQVPIPE